MAYTQTMKSARKNEILLIDLSLEQRIVVGDSLKEIMNYSTDFTQLTMNFFFDLGKRPNYKNLKEYIKSQKYYYYKAIFKAIIKILFIIMQLICLKIIFYSNNGFKSTFEIIRNAVFFLKFVHFFFFDCFYIINEIYFLINLERIKIKKKKVIYYQTLGYILNGIIYLLIIFNKTNNDNVKKENIIDKKDKIIAIIISVFFDVVKYFIK